jgi:hypothetical protein
MAMQGAGALAMWWQVAAGARAEFEHWHAHEHFPERLALPGFLRASRWRDAAPEGDGVFMLYELQDWDTLASPAYLARLQAPTPWSVRMMPHHRGMVRCQCRVLASSGGAVGGQALTVRLAASEGRAGSLRAQLETLVRTLPQRPGLTGAHLLRHQAPAIAQTTEQKIRGGDAVADWILLVVGYDGAALDALAAGECSVAVLAQAGAAAGVLHGRHALSQSALPDDFPQETPRCA